MATMIIRDEIPCMDGEHVHIIITDPVSQAIEMWSDVLDVDDPECVDSCDFIACESSDQTREARAALLREFRASGHIVCRSSLFLSPGGE